MTQTAVPLGFVRGSCWDTNGDYYPATGEREVPLTTIALRLILYLYTALSHVFATRDDVYVGADQFFYWDPNDKSKTLAPDGYVIFGIPKTPPRSVIRTWQEALPAFVAEISNRECRNEDRVRKLAIYRDVLRVPEYLIYDEDTGELLLYSLQGAEYVLQQPDEQGRFYSPTLGVWFAPDTELGLRVYDPAGHPIPWTHELFWERDEMLRRNDLLSRVLERVEKEREELRERLERERAEYQRRLEQERTELQQSLQAERQRADALAAELERLRAERREQGNGE